MQSLGPVEFLRVLDRSLMLSYHEVRTRVAEAAWLSLLLSCFWNDNYILHTLVTEQFVEALR
jgi:hypothetical protein